MPVSEDRDEAEETEDIYDDDQREEQIEEDQIYSAEAGFMEGYTNPEETEEELNRNLRRKKRTLEPLSFQKSSQRTKIIRVSHQPSGERKTRKKS